MTYNITPVEDLPTVFSLLFKGKPFAEVSGGNAMLIYKTFCDIKRFDERRADDFMHGVQFGLLHQAYGCSIRMLADAPPRDMEWPPRVKPQPRPEPTPMQQEVEIPSKAEPTPTQQEVEIPSKAEPAYVSTGKSQSHQGKNRR